MTSSNYQSNSVDLDSTYIVGNDPNYQGIQAAVTNRKTVVFGQQLINQAYPVGNLNGAINYTQSLPGTMVDQDSTRITGVGPTAVFYNNRANAQSLIRGSFGISLENYPQNLSWQINGTNQLAPAQQPAYSTWTSIVMGGQYSTDSSYWSVAIQSNGTLWAWGINSWGGIGLNTTTNYNYPVQVGALNNWAQIACGMSDTLAIQSNGTLWAWGNNSYGQLGTINQTHYSSPVQVGALSTWKKISSGWSHSAAIQTNGTLWTWGYNGYGALGTGNITNYSSPVQVGALSVWTQITCGNYYTAALQSNGTLWAWGLNQQGQLGLGNQTNYSSPIQVGNLSTWTQVVAGSSSTMSIQSNGTLWACGYNFYGNLGLNTSTSKYSSPVQVGTLSTWSQISCGYSFVIALQTPGTLWTWGNNQYGRLGLNTLTNGYSSPVQVGALSVWTKISCGYITAAAIQTPGTLYTWGNNSFGQLGLTPLGISVTKITYGL